MYTENDLVRLAKRENNNKRGYLVVNRLQGKHIPVVPSEAFAMFHQLGELVRQQYQDEKLLLVGFAETATAIGASLAVFLKCEYIQTTREQIDGVEYFYFSESHSHATEQKLVKDDIDRVITTADRVVFIEDEVTTGNTILNIVKLMKKEYSESIRFGVASLLNGMNEQAAAVYQELDIPTTYLVKTDHGKFDEKVADIPDDGIYIPPVKSDSSFPAYMMVRFGQYQNARRLVNGNEYGQACEALWDQINNRLGLGSNQRLLVLGTEEFMYPAMYTAWKLEQQQNQVRFHATTRSPIAVSKQEHYPLHTRYELTSLYEDGRTTYLYNLDKYDKVLLITDSDCENGGAASVFSALMTAGNDHVIVIRWCD